MNAESCRATQRGAQSAELLDLRTACLQQRLEELRARVDVLGVADAEVAQKAVQRMPSIESCADVAALQTRMRPPSDPAARARIDGLRKQLARARSLRDTGQFGEGRKIATAVAAAAQSIGFRPFTAEALLTLGQLQESLGDYPTAAKTLYDAELTATAGRDDEVAAHALTFLVWVSGLRLHKYNEAHQWTQQATATIERLGHKRELEAELNGNLSAVATEEGKLDEALAFARRDLELTEGSDGPDAQELATIHIGIGEIFRGQARNEDALVHYRRAIDIMEKSFGPGYPHLAAPINDIGLILYRLGHDEEALVQHRRALAIWQKALGPEHQHVAEALNNIGVVLLAQGKAREALDVFRRTQAIDAKATGPDSPEAASDRVNVGDALRTLGRLGEALVEEQRALAIIEKQLGPNDRLAADAHIGIAKVLTAQRRANEAVVHDQSALAILGQALGERHPALAEPLVGMGEALLSQHATPPALAALDRAVRLLEAAPANPHELDHARRLLARARRR